MPYQGPFGICHVVAIALTVCTIRHVTACVVTGLHTSREPLTGRR